MQAHEAFKLGFLARCVEEGLSPEQTHALAKQAADCVEKRAFAEFFNNPAQATLNAGSAALNFGRNALDLGRSSLPYLAAGATIPPALGGLAAYLANSATDVDEGGAVEDVKKQELIDSYQRMADQLARQKQLRDYKKKRKQTGRVYL